MFGYLTVYKPELKFKEFELYKAVYCSLCKNLKKNYGLFTSLTLNYETTFLALFSLGLDKSCPRFESCRCTFNPFKRCNKCIVGEDRLDFASAVTVILSYYKLIDEIKDSGFLKKILLCPLKPFLKIKFKKATKKFPLLQEVVALYSKEQSDVEKSGCKEVDVAANPTAKMLASVFSMLDCNNDNLERFGYCIGRWIYLMDAYDDMFDDLKKANYNVFVANVDGNNIDSLSSYAYGVLNFTLGETIDAFDKIETNHFNPIFYNIIRDGMTQAQDSAREKARKNNEKSL